MLLNINQEIVDLSIEKISHTNEEGNHSVEFKDYFFKDITFREADLTGCRFVRCKFSRVDFSNCKFDDVVFSSCDFEDCDFAMTKVESTVFSGCYFEDILFLYAELNSLTFANCIINFCTFSGSTLVSVRFQNCIHHRIGLQGVIIHKCEGLELKVVSDSRGHFLIFDKKDNCIYHRTVAGKPTDVLNHLTYSDRRFLTIEYKKELASLINSLVA